MLCTGIWAASGASGQFWPVWVLLVVLIPLLRNSWRLYGPAPELDRVERELEQQAHQERGARGRDRAAAPARRRSALLLVPDVVRLDHELDPLLAGLAEGVLVLVDVLLRRAR